jgi:anti-sigma regulatory factor (Ser/Thr protein kinase)
MMHHDRLELDATLGNIPRFRAFVEDACARGGISADDCFAIKLAVDEACSNIIEHGYGPGGAGTISLIFEASQSEVRVTVIDTGRPFAPEEAPVPDVGAPWQDRPIGGLGWHLIRNMVDEIRYQTDGAENRLTLVKRFAKTSGPGNEEERDNGRDD